MEESLLEPDHAVCVAVNFDSDAIGPQGQKEPFLVITDISGIIQNLPIRSEEGTIEPEKLDQLWGLYQKMAENKPF